MTYLEGIIFDFDGTLADTLPLCLLAFQEALREVVGRDYSAREIAAHFGPSEEGIFRRMVPEHADRGLAVYLSVYRREHGPYSEAFPGVASALERLRERGVRLAIVTGKGSQSAAISMELLGISSFFDTVETGSADSGIKPAAIRKVLNLWNLEPSRVAYVGDQPSDIRDAREVGVVPLAAAWANLADPVALGAESPAATFCTVGDFVTWFEAGVSP